MEDQTITVEEHPTEGDIRTVIRNLVDYNDSQAEKERSQPLAIFIRDSNGEIVSGLLSQTHWGWLFITHLWVAESLRGKGYARKLMIRAELEAKKRGCHHAYVDTFSFQALGFYEKLGYQVFGVLEDFPPGHKRYFLQKRNLET